MRAALPLLGRARRRRRAPATRRCCAAVDRVWANAVDKRLFVTGGLGSSARNEGFTVDYDLPTFSAYQETCASIAFAMLNHRLALLNGDSRYADLVEWSLYNAVAAGISLAATASST